MKPLLLAAAGAAMTVAAATGPVGCAARPILDDDRDPAADARAADLDAFPLTKPVLPPLVLPPHRVSTVAERLLPCVPAVAFVARRPNARTLQRVIDEAMDELLQDPTVRDGATGQAVLVYRGRTTDLDRPFDLEVGLVVRPDVKPAAKGVVVVALPPLRAMAVAFDGPVAALDKAYDHLLPEVRASPVRPTGEVREVYARWPGAWPDGQAGADDRVLPTEGTNLPDGDVLVAVGVEGSAPL